MKNLVSLVAALFFVTIAAQAQMALPNDPGATFLGPMMVTTHVEIEILGKKKASSVSNEVLVYRTTTDGIAFVMSTHSITPLAGGDIDMIPTKEIFRQISTNAVVTAAQQGRFGMSGVHATNVWIESNVMRYGSGAGTRFEACAVSDDVSRDYVLSFDNGMPVVHDMTTTSYPTACGAGGSSIQ